MAGEHGGGHGHGDSRSSILQIDPDAVPLLRNAFVDALARVDQQLTVAEHELRVTAWAKDPVSQDAAALFNERSVDTVESAVDSLRAYREQLNVAVANLDKTAEQYSAVDQDGRSGVNKTG
ncbi:transcriptional regulator [Actinophytocola sp.]|uniref:transcriptional regulator n=1 Tax=Actinophytocola sp. TaxID=1872138 RepID=UPI002EDA5EC2